MRLAWAMLVLLAGCATQERYEFARVCMGVRARVVLYASSAPAAERAAAAAFAELARLDAIMSDYRRDSEVSALADAAGTRAVPISTELAEVLLIAGRIHRDSEGAFDITVAPAVRCWREARRTKTLPAPDELARALALIDGGAVRLSSDSARDSAFLPRQGMRIDLGGIAKGYAAERTVTVLRRHGAPRCLVALAGDVFAGDPPPGEEGWRVSLGDRPANAAPVVVLIRNQGVSTSGNAEQFVEIGGVRYSHIVDPRTGIGSTRHVQASVIAPEGALADALSTAACLLEPEALERLIKRFDRTACVLVGRHAHTQIIDPCDMLRRGEYTFEPR